MVKTSLCNEGILPLNIGIVDPRYHAKLSSFLVNFGKDDRLIRKGEVFIRLTFQNLDTPSTKVRFINQDDDAYLWEKIKNISERFSSDFRDLTLLTRKLTKELFNEYLVRILTFVGGVALVLGIITFLLNFGNLLLVQKYLVPSDTTRAEILNKQLSQVGSDLQNQSNVLVDKVGRLEDELKKKTEQLDDAISRIDRLEQKTPLPATPSSK
jgi:hypothetical protein